ncbi:unnamed protein product [Heligmosomoides polygyrus]|uniref:Uncharacterized protein n=1 Tax=Heligmosomoides polygyrus TaxID=6339 RepID=A0A183FYX9_HELPZ|nr:unnamed protein product [Heligmosomoides polygyrus]
MVTFHTFQKLQEWRNEDAQHNYTAKEEYRKLLDDINNSRTLTREEKDEILIFLHNYERRRCILGRYGRLKLKLFSALFYFHNFTG